MSVRALLVELRGRGVELVMDGGRRLSNTLEGLVRFHEESRQRSTENGTNTEKETEQ